MFCCKLTALSLLLLLSRCKWHRNCLLVPSPNRCLLCILGCSVFWAKLLVVSATRATSYGLSLLSVLSLCRLCALWCSLRCQCVVGCRLLWLRAMGCSLAELALCLPGRGHSQSEAKSQKCCQILQEMAVHSAQWQ